MKENLDLLDDFSAERVTAPRLFCWVEWRHLNVKIPFDSFGHRRSLKGAGAGRISQRAVHCSLIIGFRRYPFWKAPMRLPPATSFRKLRDASANNRYADIIPTNLQTNSRFCYDFVYFKDIKWSAYYWYILNAWVKYPTFHLSTGFIYISVKF